MILEVLLRVYIEGYLSICICCLISLEGYNNYEHSYTHGDTFAIVYCIFSLITLIIIPLFILAITFIYKDHLKDQEKLGRYAMFFTDLNRDRSSQIIYHALFFIRRFFLSIVLVFGRIKSNLQLILTMFTSIIWIIYVVKS